MKKFLHSRDGASKGAALIVLAFVVIATAVRVGGQTCPTPLRITFSGVIFDCGCTPSDEGLTTSRIVSQGTFNGSTVTFNNGIDVFCASGTDCAYRVPRCATDVYPELVTFWEKSSTCQGATSTPTPTPGGSPDPSQPFNSAVCNVLLIFTGGVYHLFAVDIYRGVIFYGTRSDLNGPFTNTVVSCNRTYTNWNNPAVICAFGAATNLTVIAHDGTATISLPPP
jgi:hypothetical protein